MTSVQGLASALGSPAVLSAIASSALVSAVVTAVLSFFFNRRLQREKAELDARLATLNNTLQQQAAELSEHRARVTSRLQTAFSTLQSERATVIKELYARIVAVEVIFNEIAVSRRVTEDTVSKYQASVADFVSYFLPNRIWFPSTVSQQVAELRSLLNSFEKPLALERRSEPVSRSFREGLIVFKGATAQALEDISRSFRSLLGAESGLEA